MTVFAELSENRRSALRLAGLNPEAVADLIRRSVLEDLDGGVDVTSVATVPLEQRSRANFVSRVPGTLCGADIARCVVEMLAGNEFVAVEQRRSDGDRVEPGDVIMAVDAPSRKLLTAERTALNLLCHLSGVATLTSRWVDAVAGTGAVIRDTRKTTPGLRRLEKYAVRCGGGQNHRMSLSDAALVKDNHIAAAGSIDDAVRLIRSSHSGLVVEVEVDSLGQLREALRAGVDLVLLDNMTIDQMKQAVDIAARHRESGAGAVVLEASGGLSLDNARDVALTGVDFLAIGALTHSAPSLDIGLDFLAP